MDAQHPRPCPGMTQDAQRPRLCPGMTQAPKSHVLQQELNSHELTCLTLKDGAELLWHLQSHRNCVVSLLLLPAMWAFCFFSLISGHWCLLISTSCSVTCNWDEINVLLKITPRTMLITGEDFQPIPKMVCFYHNIPSYGKDVILY